jgi:hypothetical protein
MMYSYKVTNELKTSRWKKFLRWLRIIKPRVEFKIVLNYAYYLVGEQLLTGSGTTLLIVGRW